MEGSLNMNKFHIQLYEFVKRNGERHLTTPQLTAMMDDEGLFRSFANKPYKLLFRFMVNEGYVKQFYSWDEWKEDEAEKLEADSQAMPTFTMPFNLLHTLLVGLQRWTAMMIPPTSISVRNSG